METIPKSVTSIGGGAFNECENLKSVTFYEKLGSVYDKTQRLRKLAGFLSDDLNISKEKVQVAASISKSDLCSDLVGEYPELQGVMGKYFAIEQGFEEDISYAMYPNPVTKGNTVSVNTKNKIEQIQLINILGKKILTTNKNTIYTRDLAKGSYIITIKFNDGRKVKNQLIVK